MHDLHQFQRGGITDILGFGEFFVYVTDAGQVPVPEYLQDFQFTFRWFYIPGCRHKKDLNSIYDKFRNQLLKKRKFIRTPPGSVPTPDSAFPSSAHAAPSPPHTHRIGLSGWLRLYSSSSSRVVWLDPSWLQPGGRVKYRKKFRKEPDREAFLKRSAQVLNATMKGLKEPIFLVSPYSGRSSSFRKVPNILSQMIRIPP